MKSPMVLTVGACLLFSSPPLTADQTEDEVAIRKVIKAIISTTNDHDAKAMMSYCDRVYEFPDGRYKGIKASTEAYARTFDRSKDFHIEQLEEIGIVFITPDVAIYKDRRRMTGYIDPDGNPGPPQTRLTAWVMVKRNGDWLCAAFFVRPIEE